MSIELLMPERAAEVLQGLSARDSAAALARLEPEALRRVIEALPGGRAARLIASLEGQTRDRVLSTLPPKLAAALAELLQYPADTAGSLMDPRVTLFPTAMTVADALARIRTFRVKEFDSIYVVDAGDRLVGAVGLADLVTSELTTPLGTLFTAPPITVLVTASREEIVEAVQKTRVTALPVVDADRRLIGVLRQSALADAAREVSSAGIAKMVGAGKDERAMSPPRYAVRQRLPWLQINLLTAFAAASVVGAFESTIAEITALAVLLPVVAGQSGNSGMQALAVAMRGLALREIGPRDWPRLVAKEAGVGLANGVAIAATSAVAVLIWSRSPGLAFVIGVAMVVAMCIAGVAGAAVPLILKACGLDPAQSSSIVLTTVTDISGFFSFLGLATIFTSLLR